MKISRQLSLFFLIFNCTYFLLDSLYGQSSLRLKYEIPPVTIDLLNTQSPIIEGTINGKKAYFLVDTGSTITVLDLSQKKDYSFRPYRRLNKKLVGYGGKYVGLWSVLDVDMRIGKRFVSTPFLGISLVQLKEYLHKKTGYKISGIIGADVILDYGIMVDFVNRECHIGIGKNLTKDIGKDSTLITKQNE